VAEPTRGLNLLDVVLANDPIAVCDVRVVQQFCGSDHEQVEFLLYSCDSAMSYIWCQVYMRRHSGRIGLVVNALDLNSGDPGSSLGVAHETYA
jgi:hypothetical protein